MDTINLPPRGQSVEFIKINESLEWFGTEMSLEPKSKPEIEGIHLHHKDMSK